MLIAVLSFLTYVLGKVESKETRHFLLNIRESGKQAIMNDFSQRCRDDPAAF